MTETSVSDSVKRYARYLMVMAGLGGLLYGIDVGVIAAAVPYIEETSTYSTADFRCGSCRAIWFGAFLPVCRYDGRVARAQKSDYYFGLSFYSEYSHNLFF